MDFKKLQQWSKEEFVCACGLITKNGRKKEHLASETHYWLNKTNYKNITGKSIVKCERCNKSVMVLWFCFAYKKLFVKSKSMSNYYEENKEAIRERARKYYYSHKDKCKQYRERNKKRISERYRMWYQKHAEKKKYAREAKRLQNEKLCERNKRLVD